MDPVDSRLAYTFDTQLDAICAAAEAADYTFDRWWLPWPNTGGGTSAAAMKQQLSKTTTAGSSAREFESIPGILLFRPMSPAEKQKSHDEGDSKEKSPGNNQIELLVVFLVGETASAGIHKTAFRSCLEIIGHLDKTRKPRQYSVLGPTCSGTVDSLRIAIAAWRRSHHGDKFRFISPSATSVSDFADEDQGISFSATVHPDTAVLKRLREFLRKEMGRHRIAVLSESNTAYGRATANDSESDDSVVTFRFPMHIAALRPVYEAERSRRGQLVSKYDPFASQVPIPFDTSHGTRDVVPTMDGGMTAVASDQLMTQLVELLSEGQFDAVGLVATDVRDKIFLAYLVKKYCPLTTLFTTDTELLLTNREHRRYLAGTICAHTYPLYQGSKVWEAPKNLDQLPAVRHVTFGSQEGYGTYNAVLALLNKPTEMIEYAPPYFDCGAEVKDGNHPGIWLSVVGESGFWPLKYCSESCEGASYLFVPEKPPLRGEPLTLDYSTVESLFSLIVGMVCITALWGLPKYFWDRVATPRPVLASRELVIRRAVWGGLCIAGILGVSLYFLLVWTIPLKSPVDLRPRFVLPCLMAELFVTVALFSIAMAVQLGKMLQGRVAPKGKAFLLLGCAVGGIGILGVYALTMPVRTNEQAFRFARAIHFESGLSPLLSVTLLGAIVFGWGRSQLLVTQQLAQYRIPSPFPKNSEPYRADQTLFAAILWPWGKHGRRYFLPWLAVTALLLLLCALRLRMTYEGVLFSLIFHALFSFLAAAAVAGLFHIQLVASALFRLTEAIGYYPLQNAFRRLPEKASQRYGRFFTARRPGLEEFEFAVQQWDALSGVPWLRFAFKGDLQRADGATTPPARLVTPRLLRAFALWSIVKLSRGKWARSSLRAAYPAVDAGPPAPAQNSLDKQLEQLEEFVAICTMLYLSQFLVYLRHQMFMVTVAPIMMLLAVTLYRFEPQYFLTVVVDGLIIASVLLSLKLIVQINRDETFSYISQTAPFYLTMDRDLALSFAAYASPLVVLILTRFDEVSNWLFSWMRAF